MTGTGFRPAGLITLTTDFGLADPFVGIMKGRILSTLPTARIVDLTHGIPAQRADLGGFWLRQAWRDFPEGTVHLAVVDPGVGTDRGVVLAQCRGQVLVAPDNGLLAEALRGEPAAWRMLDPEVGRRVAGSRLSLTFHGRDLFAPLAAELAAARVAPRDVGPQAQPADPAPLPVPQAGPGEVIGQILLTDGFGNLITNIDAGLLADMRQPSVAAGGRVLPVLATYGAAEPGCALAVINSFELLELAVRDGRADDLLGLAPGDRLRVTDGQRT